MRRARAPHATLTTHTRTRHGYARAGQFNLSDEDFDRLKDELNWQGSGFPTLHREEIEFVEASIAYARGQPVVSDEQYDVLKRSVRCAPPADMPGPHLETVARKIEHTALPVRSKEQNTGGLWGHAAVPQTSGFCDPGGVWPTHCEEERSLWRDRGAGAATSL
jgi:hypothetical protein